MILLLEDEGITVAAQDLFLDQDLNLGLVQIQEVDHLCLVQDHFLVQEVVHDHGHLLKGHGHLVLKEDDQVLKINMNKISGSNSF